LSTPAWQETGACGLVS